MSLIESSSVGLRTRIGAFVHILPSAVIGEDCVIGDYAFIGDDVFLGDRVTVKAGARLCHRATVESGVHIGENATLSDDMFPPAKSQTVVLARTVVKHKAFVGANATILPGLTIGERSAIAPGSMVESDVPALAIVTGSPASIIGYEGIISPQDTAAFDLPPEAGSKRTRVAGVTYHRLPSAADMRGQLAFAEIGTHVPFAVKRFFLIYGVANKEVRGEHAHRTLHQFLVCVHGRCSVVADDSENRQEFLLDHPTAGLHLPPLVWAVQYKHSADAILLVLASDHYDPADYIRNYAEFLQELSEQPHP